MRKSAIDHMIFMANDDDYIEIITSMYKPISIRKRSLVYAYFDYCIRINDNSRKEQYMIQLETVEAIKVTKPKFKGMTWYSGMEKTEVGA